MVAHVEGIGCEIAVEIEGTGLQVGKEAVMIVVVCTNTDVTTLIEKQ